MFTIKTRIGPSSIHGTGVFAVEDIAEGEVVWKFMPPFDRPFDDAEIEGLPEAVRGHLDYYGYRSVDLGGKLVLSGDHAKFLNHADEPNTREIEFASVASRPIGRGDEITCNYRSFCINWMGFEDVKAPWPHDKVFTRLGPSRNGIGVFAIAQIPAATLVFARDDTEIVRVPKQIVSALGDPEIERLYFDFCPTREDAFLAPTSFNQLTVGWYLNHSDCPNVEADSRFRFFTRRAINRGEELTADYSTYSEHAHAFIRNWRVS
jgi:SET domain-containing protein